MRHRAAVAALVLLAAATAAVAADQVVVEDWKSRLGATGVPPEWTKQSWGSPKYDFKVEEHEGRPTLRMKSVNEGSTISKEIKISVKETPVLEWSWKMVTLPKGGNSCKKELDDQAGQIFVTWPRFPKEVRSRIIGYVWDSTQPAGTICKSEKTSMVTYVVVRSGQAEVGKWFTERRNVADDFKKIYEEAADNPGAISLSIDSNDTKSTAESYMGPILFKKP
ncbi:MAG TPA: DUF3047 domain-containing protein [Methylomirabilota bacterium]|jgi:hypothetical protein|nr:DUF3047 domain-containing protein [Methylomirabilota bacterium]